MFNSRCSLQNVKWILCDSCSTWLHKYCVGLEEIDDPTEFFCEACKKSHGTKIIGENVCIYNMGIAMLNFAQTL